MDPTAERARDGTDEIFTIRLPAPRVNTKNGNELHLPSHKCYLRAARRGRQGRSPQGRAARALTTSSTARRRSCDGGHNRIRKQKSALRVQSVRCVICDEYATNSALANVAQITRRFNGGLRHRHRGVSNPPGRASGRRAPQNRGVAHAPAPSVTSAKRISCAAQIAAFVVLPSQLASRWCRENCERSS